mmetsp:Transcript_9076/g.17696  ORF Transcript_9076/g.17696 Transcript_9076/m.17696 type:complete len:246 (+) Transcript_9076:462-1199(+)
MVFYVHPRDLDCRDRLGNVPLALMALHPHRPPSYWRAIRLHGAGVHLRHLLGPVGTGPGHGQDHPDLRDTRPPLRARLRPRYSLCHHHHYHPSLPQITARLASSRPQGRRGIIPLLLPSEAWRRGGGGGGGGSGGAPPQPPPIGFVRASQRPGRAGVGGRVSPHQRQRRRPEYRRQGLRPALRHPAPTSVEKALAQLRILLLHHQHPPRPTPLPRLPPLRRCRHERGEHQHQHQQHLPEPHQRQH